MSTAATPATGAAGSSPPPEQFPWLGLTAVLLGTFISTLTTRLSSFGLADIRGAVHAGFDDGAWITTAQSTAQMLITPFAVWAGSIYGPRRILLAACMVFAAAELLLPLSPNLPTLLVLQFISGLGSGCFIPLTLPFILLRTPRRLWSYSLAAYALNLDLSTHLSASLEGWYVDHASWRWVFWQNVPLAIAMAACLYFGVKMWTPPPTRPKADIFGLTTFGVGLALIYAALDQGNRLDWLNSGLVRGLLSGGGVLLIIFYVHARYAPNSWLNVRVALSYPLPFIMALVALLRAALLATAFLVPQFLTAVRGFRTIEVGDALLWVALPQLLLFPIAGYVVRFVDPRIGAAIGLGCIASACLLVAYGLTPLWGSDQFLFSQLLQALGQSLAITGIIYTAVLHLRPEIALTFGGLLQATRLFGGEVGQAFIATLQRIREQRASNLIGLHVQAGDEHVMQRLQAYGHIVARGWHGDGQVAAAEVLLGRTVRNAATTQSVIDCYVALGAVATLALFVLARLNPPPGTTSAWRSLLDRWRS